ncbi:MAG TPA: glycosyltransferase [Longimicrobiales bacterium]
MNSFGQTICLCMIVKNEAPVIRRCLDSLDGFIDAWVVVDTGSTDGTQDIVRERLKHLPGELIERPWVDFAHNRSEALAYARGRADYVFVIDADEVLVFDEDFALPRLDRHAYHFVIESGGVSYFKTQLVDNTLDWCFRSVVHEYIYCPDARTEAVLPGVRTLRFPDGARARDPNTYRRDALLLERALLDEPDNTRYVFYLAQSYRDANEPELAIRHYLRRAELGGWIEEVWYSLYQVAEIKARRGDPWPEVLDAYLTAYQAKPDRAEPLYRIGVHYQKRREYALSHLYFRQAMEIPYPVQDRLFIEAPVYRFLMPLEYGVACYYVGDDASAVETYNRLLLDPEVPAEVQAQVEENRRYSLERLYPSRSAPRTEEHRILLLLPFRDPGPWLDDCIESLLEQSHAAFAAVFIDDASRDSHEARLPADDRFIYRRNEERRGLAACALDALREWGRPDDVVLALDAFDWLADAAALATLNAFFNAHDCDVCYGQHRFSSGHAGAALPIGRAAEFERLRTARPCVMPVAFRADVLLDPARGADLEAWLRDDAGEWLDGGWLDALGHAVLEAAGFERAHFNERPLVVLNLEHATEPAAGRARAAGERRIEALRP